MMYGVWIQTAGIGLGPSHRDEKYGLMVVMNSQMSIHLIIQCN